MKRRRLADLYVRGRDLNVDDGSEDPVKIWLQKLNGIDRDAVIRRANAAKARYLMEADDEESDAFIEMYGQVREFDKSSLMGIITAEDIVRARGRIEAQMATDEEGWGKDGYLQGLYDSWTGDDENPGLRDRRLEDPDDPEAQQVLDELTRFELELGDTVRLEAEHLDAQWESRPDDAVWRAAAKQMIKHQSEEVFVREYQRQVVFHSVREPDAHSRRHFESLAEVDDLDPNVKSFLTDQCMLLMVETSEGKDSRASQDSSNSSASPAEVEASPNSGPVAVNA